MGEGLRALARFAATHEARQLPQAMVEKAKACLLYGLAVGVGCMRTAQPAQAAHAIADAGIGKATAFFDGRNLAPGQAAFANGVLFHARVQDDAHPAGHIGVVVIPTALAMAESVGARGLDLVMALVAGYETALRIGRDHAADLSTRGFRTTPAYGVLGAAAAAGRLLGLDTQRMAHALSLAANMAGGLREYSEAGSEEFPFQAGTAAANGILAAHLAAAGATSAPTALDGRAGFFRAFGETGRRYGMHLADGLGAAFEMAAVTYKPYPICQFHRGIVRGAATLRARAGTAKLASLTIRMNPFEADFFGVRYAGPFTTFPQAFMSAPFCAALAWAHGTAAMAGLNNFQDPAVNQWIPRIAVVADAERERYGPKLTARLDDGAILEWEERERADAYLLTWVAARNMAAGLCAEMGVAPALTERLESTVEALDRTPDIVPVAHAMRAACAAVERPVRNGGTARGPNA